MLDNFPILFLGVEDLKDTLVMFTNFHITLRKTVFLNCFQQNITWSYRVCKMFIAYLRQKERFFVNDSDMMEIIYTIFTGRNEVVAKVMFLQVSVIHSVHRGGVLQRTPPPIW